MNRLKDAWWEKICYANKNHRSAELDILMSGQTDFKTKIVTRCEEVYFTAIESLTVREVCHKDRHLIVEPWNTLSKRNRTEEYTEDQQENRGLEKHFPSHLQNSPPGNSRTVFSNTPGTLSSTDHVHGYKPSLSKFKKNGIIQSIFSKHGWMN